MRWQALITLLIGLAFTAGCGGDPKSETKSRKKPPIVKKRVQWLDSHALAVEQSKKTGKPIFAFFTGSDWCKYCSLLDHQVLNTQTFADWAKENVVLLELDFPRKTEMDPELKKQNEGLLARYKVSGFPTVLILTSDGKPVLKAGYEQVTAEQWVGVIDQKMKESLSNMNSSSNKK